MLNFSGKTILTAEIEKQFIQLGGTSAEKVVFNEAELGKALAKSIEAIADVGRYDVLRKIYETARSANSCLPAIDDVDIPDQK
ncbi:hypothetical protein HER14_06350 [Acidithiobacillus thiooxidans]|uniref:hypothetical protein n=1 Tax=Acidithiobacillus thiooxidans TaxID=930 RepID=UPI0004E251E3|nr:hypothetical protein [Acidithiobacillus thiooxidans]MBU2750571.1 hypothetical protein [Acidithiobacillus thiooxidans]MBU2836271.1 hypothetical protein [Acidithiobacillus thiooxidans]